MIKNSERYFKNRVLLIVFLVIIGFVFTFSTFIYTAEKRNFNALNTNYENTLHNSIDQTVNTAIDTYSMLADTILETTRAKELMKNGNREELYKLLQSKWETWSKINPDFKIMLFHKADGTAFLRMHKPEVYDDYLADIRPMVKSAHEQKKVLTGYETGKYSTVFRILTPIFYNGEYLGSLDFGINPNYFIGQIRKFTSQEGVLFIRQENLKLFNRKSLFSIGNYEMQTKTNKDIINILKHLPSSYKFEQSKIIKVNDSTYTALSYTMGDYKGEEKAQLLFFYNLTDTLKTQHEFTITLAITSVLFIIIMYFLLNYSFNKLLVSIKKIHTSHAREIQKKDTLLHKQSKMAAMGEMISMIAHQWRQPLGALSSISINLQIKMQLEVFDLKTEDGREECEAYFNNSLEEINSLVQNMTTTIDDFRNFYKPAKTLDVCSVDIPITKAINIIKSSFNANNINIREQYITKKEIALYSNEMVQVILNILKNAQDNFNEKKIKDPQIIITCEDSGDNGVAIKICDNGGGIKETIIGKIFDPYFSTKDEKNGTGLGLYMSKMIIENHHNGSLNADNYDDGVCFTIELKKTPTEN